MKHLIALICAISVFHMLSAALAQEEYAAIEDDSVMLLDSGTYKVTAEIVDPIGNEIYVKTDRSDMVELNFTAATRLTQRGQPVSFEALAAEQQLEVRVEKDGISNKALEVRILE